MAHLKARQEMKGVLDMKGKQAGFIKPQETLLPFNSLADDNLPDKTLIINLKKIQ